LRVVLATNGSRAQPDKNQPLDEDLQRKARPLWTRQSYKKSPKSP
jgi:hypothetical protein